MNVYFDLDYTLISFTGELRPGTHEVFQKLRSDGHRIFIWSGTGVRTDEVRALGLDVLVDGVFEKPVTDYVQRTTEMVNARQIPVPPDIIVDDDFGAVSALGGIVIRPYFSGNKADAEMERTYHAISEYAANGWSGDPSFHPRSGTP